MVVIGIESRDSGPHLHHPQPQFPPKKKKKKRITKMDKTYKKKKKGFSEKKKKKKTETDLRIGKEK